MKLKSERKEFSGGVYVYIVFDEETQERYFYVKATTQDALKFVTDICNAPERLNEILSKRSNGREIKAEAIYEYYH